MFASKDVFLKSTGGAYTIANSVRFRSSASANLNRTYAGTGTSATIKTLSMWVKRGKLGSLQRLANSNAATAGTTFFRFNASDNLDFQFESAGGIALTTTQVFRDISSWYHIVLAIDTTQATAANRVKIYVNGVQVTAFSAANYPAQNATTSLFGFASAANRIGSDFNAASEFFDGYMAEINHVDGQALTPSSFGAISTNGVWQPARYTGTYGTNGFYLKFADNSTAAALGTDSSGNSNTWTVNNISVTAGVTYDSMTDVPTLTSATAANYAVLNPLAIGFSGITISDANLTYAGSSSSGSLRGSVGVSSGLWYFEVNNLTWNSSQQSNFFGIAKDTVANSVDPGNSVDSYAIYFGGSAVSTLYKVNNSTNTSVTTTPTSPFTGMVAINLNTNKVWFGANGTWFGSGDPAAGTNAAFTIANAGTYTSVSKPSGGSTSSTGSINFGQRPFTYTPPSGFVALNTYNLSTPTIANGAAYMAATLYTGNSSTQSIVNTVNGTVFQPDFVWIKNRSGAISHSLYDVLRGAGYRLSSNETTAQLNYTAQMTGFNSNGFSVATTNNEVNESGTSYVGWQWKANGAGVSNTSGSITSTVSAGTTQGFSVVTYTGTGAAATVGHGLGVAPSMIITKNRGAVSDWGVYHTSLGNTNYILLDTTAASAASSTYWNNTSPTSSVFSIGTATPVNVSTNTYVAYCFAAVAGFSAFGSYTGNGSADGPFVYLGFRPRFILYKRSDAAGDNWRIIDTARDPYNVSGNELYPNLSSAEVASGTNTNYVDILSNGFKIRNPNQNVSGGTYIYACFAENPFKLALAR